MYHLNFFNSKEAPFIIQVDPWACTYRLNKGEGIELIFESKSEEPTFYIDEHDTDYRILTIWDSEEFFILIDGKQVHWTDYPSNYS